VAQSRYLPYGQERWTDGPAQTDFTFTGQRADNYTHLIEMGARWYDPQLNRWISPDSIVPQASNPQAWNRYAYVANNPLRFSDPTGHCWDPITGSTAGCIAAWERTIKAYQAGERRLDVLALHSSGITDRLVETSEQINRLNADAAVVFSNAPVEERVMPSVRLGIWATGTAATVVGVGQAAKAGIGALESEAETALAGKGVTNPIPSRMARIVPAQYAESPTLAAPGAQDAFVTEADDIAGITTSRGLAQHLALTDNAGNLIEGPFAVFEFDTPASGVASPVFRSNPGFVGRGLTAGGAREFVIPNSPIVDLNNLITRIVK
jgi:RHS repeat-associated protein